MADSFDKSLDDIIQAKRSARGRGGRGRGRGRGARTTGVGGRGRGGGATRRARGAQRGTPYSRPNRQIPDKWEHGMFQPGAVFTSPRGKQGGGGSKLMISNLDYGVSDADLKELFSEFGRLSKAEVHYDKSGRSLGTATIIYGRTADAQRALKQYNGVPLDGRPMSIQLLGTGVAAAQGGAVGVRQQQQRGRQQQQQSSGFSRGGRGGRGRSGRGRGGRGRGRGKGPMPTAEELDAELDAYNKQAEPMES